MNNQYQPPSTTFGKSASTPSTNVANLFPTPIGMYTDENHLETKKVLIELMNDAPHQESQQCPNLIHYFDDNDSVLTKNGLESFRNWVEEKALIFAKDVLGYSIDELSRFISRKLERIN